jgi:hypothetical protein
MATAYDYGRGGDGTETTPSDPMIAPLSPSGSPSAGNPCVGQRLQSERHLVFGPERARLLEAAFQMSSWTADPDFNAASQQPLVTHGAADVFPDW